MGTGVRAALDSAKLHRGGRMGPQVAVPRAVRSRHERRAPASAVLGPPSRAAELELGDHGVVQDAARAADAHRRRPVLAAAALLGRVVGATVLRLGVVAVALHTDEASLTPSGAPGIL